MTLVLEIGWSERATAVRVHDTAAQSTVGDGSADHPDGADDPTAWWEATVSATAQALDGLVALGLPADDLTSVVVAAGDPAGGLLALDADGHLVHPALLGSHAGSGADADWLVGHVDGGGEAWLAATDVLPTAGSTAALLSWLHRSDADAWAAARRFTLPAGWLGERLGAEPAVGAHDAIGTAVLDRRTNQRWCTELLGVVDGERDWVRALPRVVTRAEPVGLLSSAAAEELCVPAGLPLHLGGGPLEAPTA